MHCRVSQFRKILHSNSSNFRQVGKKLSYTTRCFQGSDVFESKSQGWVGFWVCFSGSGWVQGSCLRIIFRQILESFWNNVYCAQWTFGFRKRYFGISIVVLLICAKNYGYAIHLQFQMATNISFLR